MLVHFVLLPFCKQSKPTLCFGFTMRPNLASYFHRLFDGGSGIFMLLSYCRHIVFFLANFHSLGFLKNLSAFFSCVCTLQIMCKPILTCHSYNHITAKDKSDKNFIHSSHVLIILLHKCIYARLLNQGVFDLKEKRKVCICCLALYV